MCLQQLIATSDRLRDDEIRAQRPARFTSSRNDIMLYAFYGADDTMPVL